MAQSCEILANGTISNHQAVLLRLMSVLFKGHVEHFLHLCVFHSSSLTEMEKWMEDIKMAIEVVKTSNGPSSDLLTSILTDNSKLLHGVEYEMYNLVLSNKE